MNGIELLQKMIYDLNIFMNKTTVILLQQKRLSYEKRKNNVYKTIPYYFIMISYD